MTRSAGWPLGRDQFPALARMIEDNPLIYLDSAATSLTPASVIDATVRYYSQHRGAIHRGKHRLVDEASEAYEGVRRLAAEHLGCMAAEIVFTHGTTHGLNLVACGLGLDESDTILVAADSHHSNLLPWRRVAQVRMIRHTPLGTVDEEHFAELLATGPAVVVLTHCSNVTGRLTDVARLGRLAHEAGALVVVDAAQSAPHRRLDVSELDADFLAFSAHKMLGPTGLGILYGRQHLLEKLRPLEIGGGTVDWVDGEDHVLRRPPYRFEAGTPNGAAVAGFGETLMMLRAAGAEGLESHDELLTKTLYDEAARRSYLDVVGGPDPQGRIGLISVTSPRSPRLDAAARYLSDSRGIMVRSGYLCAQPYITGLAGREVLRFSTHVYNTPEEIGAAFEALDVLHASAGI